MRHRVPSIAVSVLLALRGEVLAVEGVTVSRYKLTVTATDFGVTVAAAVDPAALEEFCHDDDGCSVSLRSEQGLSLTASASRLYLGVIPAPNQLGWYSTGNPGQFADGNLNVETAATLDDGFVSCRLSDGEPPQNTSDAALGFSVVAVKVFAIPAPAKCTMVLED